MKYFTLFIATLFVLAPVEASVCCSVKESIETKQESMDCHNHHSSNHEKEGEEKQEHDCQRNCCFCCSSFYVLSNYIVFIYLDYNNIFFLQPSEKTRPYSDELLRPPILLS